MTHVVVVIVIVLQARMLEGTHPWLTASPSVLSGKNQTNSLFPFLSSSSTFRSLSVGQVKSFKSFVKHRLLFPIASVIGSKEKKYTVYLVLYNETEQVRDWFLQHAPDLNAYNSILSWPPLHLEFSQKSRPLCPFASSDHTLSHATLKGERWHTLSLSLSLLLCWQPNGQR